MMMAALERIKSNKEEEDDATPTQESPPQLFEGGTLRSYQLYGYSWLKASPILYLIRLCSTITSLCLNYPSLPLLLLLFLYL